MLAFDDKKNEAVRYAFTKSGHWVMCAFEYSFDCYLLKVS